MKRLYRAIGFLTLGWLVGSCHDVIGPPPPATVASVTFSSDAATLVPAATFQLSATARTGSGQILERNFSWSTSDPAKATVSTSGLVTGVAPGAATITAVVDGKSATAAITVLDGGVVSSSGGTLNVASGLVQLVVPADAVASKFNLWVAASSVSADDARVVKGTHFEFGPAGMTFAKSVVLKITYDPANLPSGTEEAALELYLYTSSGWEVVPGSTSDVTAKVVSAQLSHLSAYAILTPEPVSRLTSSSPRIVNGALSLVVGESEQLAATVVSGNGRILIHRVPTWSSSDATIASISATGLVQALNPGSATITASSGGSSASVVITVTPVPVASVTVALAPTSITAVETAQATATTLDANGGVLTGREVTWGSDNAAVATVSPEGVVTAVAVGTANIAATSEGKSGSSTITVTQAPVATVSVSPVAATIVQGSAEQLTATLEDAHHNPLTRPVAWSSSNDAVASVSPSGLVTANSPGGATITATSEGKTGNAALTVNPIPVASVTVSPAVASVVVGSTQELTAETRDANDNLLTGRAVTWSSDAPGTATVSTNGLVTAVVPGSATITATSEGKSGSATITVTQAPVATVTVTPTSATLILGVTPTQQLTAVTKDVNGGVLTGRTVTWASSNTGIATVDATGLVTAVSAGGPITITATSEGQTGTSSITVDPAPVATVTLSTATTPTVVGETQQLSAVTRDANGNVLTGRLITWISSNTAVLTVSPAGLVTAVGQGTATIMATSESVSATTPVITVNPVPPPPVNTVTVTPASASILVGGTQQLVAILKDVNGNTLAGRTISWVAADPAVATVDANGLVTAVSVGGPVSITATSEGKTGTSSITVIPAPVATVTLSVATTPMVVGETQQLSAVTRDANGNVLTGRPITWSSSNTAVLTVSAGGLVTAAGEGTATITAMSESVSATTPVITVTPVPPAPVNTVTVNPASASIIVGATQQLVATLKDANNNTLTGRPISWSSSDETVATVDANGLVAAVNVGGPATITATSEGKSGTSSMTVTPVPVASVTVIPGSVTLVLGITPTQQLTAVTKDVNGGVLTGRTVGWTSSNTAIATVDAGGLVTAVSVGGPITITATSEGQTGASSITVNPAPVATVILSAAATPMVVGGTQQLSATTRDANGSLLTGRLVTWQSSNTAVLTVSTNGLMTAAGEGTATITATSESVSATTNVITVNPVPPPPVATVTVSPGSATLILGVTPTQQLTAMTKDANGGVLTGRTVTWASSNTGIATVDATGLVTAVSAGGPITITATSEGQTGASSITVNPAPPPPVATVIVSPGSASVVVGSTLQLTAIVQDANDNFLTDRAIAWVSGNPAVATVNAATGLVTGVSAGGPVTITATSEGKSGMSSITVDPAPVATVTLSTATTPMVVGALQQLTAVTRDANGNLLTGRLVTWQSSNTAVLTVSTNGLVTAAGQGTATITATSESVSATTPVITVNSAALTLRASPFITSGLTAPVFLTQPLNDGRIFVVEQPGRIRVVLNGVLQATPFLDISGKLIYNGERGLLSMAFHPQYASNHYFYVYFTGLSGEIRIERFMTTSDPSVADPASETLIFTTPHAAADNHNGGLVAFGPDGMLYAAIGDGGGAGDLNGNAQNFNLYLGGMIRIDIDHGDPYSVPVDNPFVGQANKKPELWAKGLRNPWRYAFDPPTGLLFIADVGQSQHEEIDAVAATQGGLNYGWAIMEGFSCYNATTCNQTGLQLPLIDYATHVAGTCSVTGGYVYRGSAMPTIQGHYFYSDFCAGWVRSLRYQNGVAVDQKDWGIKLASVTSFGQDITGELYVTSANSIYKLVAGN